MIAFVAAVAAVLATLVVGPLAPAAAVEVPSGTFQTISSGLAINGDLTSTGNGLLTCPTSTACTALHQGGGTNNTVSMNYVDVDADPSTFNSSSATLTIPAGATLAHAWLMWEAMSGTCLGAGSGWIQATEEAVRANTPLLSVNGGAYQNVGLADFTSRVAPVLNAATDVTTELSGLSGGSHLITMANLVGTQGLGCVAGWSLHVAYDYGAFIPGNPDSALRLAYTGFGSAVVVDTNRTVTFSGFQTNAQGATFLITATDGEAPAGDSTTAIWPGGSQVLPNPSGVLNNAFNSFMPGADSFVPAIPDATFRNGSMDTYKTTASNLPSGSTSVDFRFNSPQATDGFYAHSVSMSIPAAQVRVEKLPATGTTDTQIAAPGVAPQFRIVVHNDSSVELTGATVTDANAVACSLNGVPLVQTGDDFALGTVAAGADVTVLCTGPVVVDGDAGYVNTATINAVDPQGGPVSDTDTSIVLIPQLIVTKSVNPPAVQEGETVTWTVVALNDGTTSMRNVVATDDNCTLSAPTGNGAPNLLAPGDSWTYTCTAVVRADTTNTATVTADTFVKVGDDEVVGAPVSASDDAVVTVTPAPPASATLTKTANPPVVVEGGTVTWTIVVLNDGQQDLRDVVVTDADCTGTLSAPAGPGAPTVLAVGDSWTYTCAEAVQVAKTNTASVTATPFRVVNGVDVEDDQVSDEGEASVAVTAPVPSVSVTKSVDRPAVSSGETVTWTMVVLNDGAQDLRDVTLSDVGCTGTVSTPVGPGVDVGVLAQGDAWTYTCSEVVTADKTNAATVVATPFRTVDGEEVESPPVSDTDDEFVDVAPVPVPHVTLTKTADEPTLLDGDTVNWTIVALNDGETSVRNVVVTDTDCAGTLSAPAGPGAATGTLAAGDSWTYTCAEPVTADKTNTASVTVTPFRSIDGVDTDMPEVGAEGEATVTVTTPVSSVTLTKTADQPVVVEGDTVTWTIIVANDGELDLREVVVTDTNCSGTLNGPAGPGADTGVLSHGDSWTYTCAEPVDTNTTNTATVDAIPFRTSNTGTDVPAPPIDAEGEATVEVTAPVAHLSVTKTVDDPVAVAGEEITWTITVMNDGDQDVRDVVVTDTNCTGTVGAPTGPGTDTGVLAQGDTWIYTCSEPATADKTNTADVSATPFRFVDGVEIVGDPLIAEGTAVVEVDPAPVPVPAVPAGGGSGSLSASGTEPAPWIILGALLIVIGALATRRHAARRP
ncbi:DUF7507 domain-containing protein [Agromyces ramosus]|uniref:DUF7507 domain-containing protein n=1 Tax=Agromyces ramosus TaxID=33879 RepID=UPI0027D7925A|nr:hypothetical protein [Agromyces ramosus]